MEFTTLGKKTLEKTTKAEDIANHNLNKTYKRTESYKRLIASTDGEKVARCWRTCKGNCSPLRNGHTSDHLCKICPGIQISSNI